MYNHHLIVERMTIEGYTVDQLAALAGVNADTIVRARAGGNLSVKKLKLIADAIRLPMQQLFAEAASDARSGARGKRVSG